MEIVNLIGGFGSVLLLLISWKIVDKIVDRIQKRRHGKPYWYKEDERDG